MAYLVGYLVGADPVQLDALAVRMAAAAERATGKIAYSVATMINPELTMDICEDVGNAAREIWDGAS